MLFKSYTRILGISTLMADSSIGMALSGSNEQTTKNKEEYKCNSDDSIRKVFMFSLRKIGNFKELFLRGKDIYSKLGRRIVDKDILTIVDYVIENNNIVSLDLSFNQLTDRGFTVLCSRIYKYNSLAFLNICHNELRELSEEACAMLAGNVTLKRLNLSGNLLTEQTAEYLKSILMVNKSLEILELSEVNYCVHTSRRIFESLLDGHNTTLKVLNLSRILGQHNYTFPSFYLAQLVSMLLVRNDTIVELHLEKNELTDHDLQEILSGLKENNSLSTLNLTANVMSSLGVEWLSRTLPRLNLEVLLLKGNSIGNDGAIALSKALPLSRIIHLDISNNKIGDAGLANLLWTIKKAKPLQTFFIYGNPFSTITVEIIHVQMLRDKLLESSLDISLYWDKDGTLRYAYKSGADEYRSQITRYTRSDSASKTLSYPMYDIFKWIKN